MIFFCHSKTGILGFDQVPPGRAQESALSLELQSQWLPKEPSTQRMDWLAEGGGFHDCPRPALWKSGRMSSGRQLMAAQGADWRSEVVLGWGRGLEGARVSG